MLFDFDFDILFTIFVPKINFIHYLIDSCGQIRIIFSDTVVYVTMKTIINPNKTIANLIITCIMNLIHINYYTIIIILSIIHYDDDMNDFLYDFYYFH